MSFFSKIADFINGTQSSPSFQNQNESVRCRSAHNDTAQSDLQSSNRDKTTNSSQDENQGEEKINSQLKFDKNILSSDFLSEQRYGWHRYLTDLLTSIKTDKLENLKYLTIYIRKGTNNYKWNDDAFRVELRQALDKRNLAHIGCSSIVIEAVSEKTFKQLTEKTVTDAQYRHQIDNLILFGSKKETSEQKFATAIDKRAFVISELLKKFRSSTGTDTKLMENLTIVVIRNEEDDDMAKYDWIGKRFEDDLKLELTNAFLEKIGSKSLQVILKPKSETEDCITLIDNQVYYKWGKGDTSVDDKPKEIPYERIIASVSIIEGTGSMMQPSYVLDSERKKIFHIGRGVTSRKGGKYRVNDIVIKDKEADHDLLECNAHVSSTHADIVFKNNKFYIKAAIGGCRAIGGSPTKLVRNEKETELRDTNLLYPLEDGDIIELGKNVLLVFSLTDYGSLPMNFEKEKFL